MNSTPQGANKAPKNSPTLGIYDRKRPDGWQVGSFSSYANAQAAVDMLSDMGDFPVNELTIVGVDLMEVERVTGRLTWSRVIIGGAANGAWMGLFLGLMISLFNDNLLGPITLGIAMGVIFGIVAAAVPYWMSRGRRDFTTSSQIVAGRYDVLCSPQHAVRARDAIAASNLAG